MTRHRRVAFEGQNVMPHRPSDICNRAVILVIKNMHGTAYLQLAQLAVCVVSCNSLRGQFFFSCHSPGFVAISFLMC